MQRQCRQVQQVSHPAAVPFIFYVEEGTALISVPIFRATLIDENARNTPHAYDLFPSYQIDRNTFIFHISGG